MSSTSARAPPGEFGMPRYLDQVFWPLAATPDAPSPWDFFREHLAPMREGAS